MKACAIILTLFLFAPGFTKSAEHIRFNRDIRPILSDKCYSCHGPDAEARKAELRLDTEEGAFEVLVAGKPEESELIYRIETDDKDDLMPPPKSHLSLKGNEKNALRRWISEGAKWEGHWAFQPIEQPESKRDESAFWGNNEIDAFVLERLEAKSLQPSPAADRATWLRRVTQDLTGLPPSLKDLDSFLADPSPGAQEKVVDRLLDSIDYAERMTAIWLDSARYADSNAFQFDNARTMWPWRDWVIEAFRRNIPYDQFVIEQLAGDLLKNPTQDQLIATGFNRNHGYSIEGGIIDEEYRVMYANDKTTTVGTLFLGLTMECTRCHDHKYDPLTMKDYYSLYAFFNTSAERGAPGESGRKQRAAAPFIKYRKDSNIVDPKWNVLAPLSAEAANQSLTIQKDASLLAGGKVATKDSYTVRFRPEGSAIRSIRLEVLPINGKSIGPVGRAPNGNFVLNDFSLTLIEGEKRIPVKLSNTQASHNQDGFPISHAIDAKPNQTGWAILGGQNKAQFAKFEVPKAVVISPGALLEAKLHSVSHAQHVIGRFRLSVSSDASIQKSKPVLAMVMKEQPRESRILKQGLFDQPGEKVVPQTPAVLPGFDGYAPNRLGLAQWLTDGDNPLFARVTVNRLWQQFFGSGIVETPDNFGLQGDLPSHPRLLDWLAAEFRDSGWDLQHIIKRIVLSDTYNQSSNFSPQLEDPDNRLLARGPSFRLPAELIRDQALAASGLLSRKVGGPSVFPYQPKGVWGDLNAPPSHAEIYKQSSGEDLYRKSLYTYWRRAVPHPAMSAFDAPSRDVCTVERIATNTPLQALVTLHGPTYIEAARVLAVRTLENKEPIPGLFRSILSRRPTEREEELLKNLLEARSEHYLKHPLAVDRLLQVGESPVGTGGNKIRLAALTDVCHTIFNLSETVTRK